MTDQTARFALPLLQPGQAQKEMFHNEALTRIDAMLHPAVPTAATSQPPEQQTEGQEWLVGPAPTGAWAGQAGAIATWTSGGWRFSAAAAGMQVWVTDAGRWVWHDGSGWRSDPLPTSGISVAGKQIIGARRPAIIDAVGGEIIDGQAREAVSAILRMLRSHGLIES